MVFVTRYVDATSLRSTTVPSEPVYLLAFITLEINSEANISIDTTL